MQTLKNNLEILVNKASVGELLKEQDYVFNYNSAVQEKDFVSLTMPVRASSYKSKKLLPIFEMHLPEGYLLSVLQRHFSKIIGSDDLSLLNLLAPSIKGRLTYKNLAALETNQPIYLENLLNPQEGLFEELVEKFALRSAVSGVQPKVLAQVQDKATLQLDDYIVKTWGDDYPQLALNEYWCMQIVKAANIPVPDFYLSADTKFFIMKRFDLVKDSFLGFEDACVLQGKSREEKYDGSYEQLAKTLVNFISPQNKSLSLKNYFKMIVLNQRLENGDAHLKNFGVLYQDIENIWLAPAYDIVSTTAYIKQDVSALYLMGSRKWWKRSHLIDFGVNHCNLTPQQANELYDECLVAIKTVGKQLKQEIKSRQDLAQQEILQHLIQLAEKAE